MDKLDFGEIKALARPRKNVGISIYMSFNDGTQADLKNPALIREILDKAAEKLVNDGVKNDVVSKLLKPGYDLAGDETYWRDKFETLAVFLFAGEFHTYKLPLKHDTALIISRYPYLKPIMGDYLTNKQLYVLVLAAGGSKLFKFDKYSYFDITPKEIEKSSKEYADFFQVERETNYHIKRGGGGHTKEGLISHGHDNTEQLNKTRALEYAHFVAKEVKKISNKLKLPLALAGIKSGFLAPTFRSVYDGVCLLDDYIQVETEPIDMVKLQIEAGKLIEKIEMGDEIVALELVTNLLGTGFEEGLPDQIVQFASEGRVDTLFVNSELDVYGTISVFNGICEAKVTDNPEDEDLTNVAVISTWRNKGRVYFLPGKVIGERPLMALLRY